MELAIPADSAWPQADDDASLVERAKRDREAFAQLYRRHQAAIAGYILRRVGDAHVAEDLVADVFLTALRYLPRFRQRGVPIRSWLYRIATNRVNRWVRRERRRLVRSLETEPASIAADQTIASNESVVRTVMLTLKPRFQSVLSLHYLEGMSVEDVAVALGCRVGTVKSRLSRGREALRRLLVQRSVSP